MARYICEVTSSFGAADKAAVGGTWLKHWLEHDTASVDSPYPDFPDTAVLLSDNILSVAAASSLRNTVPKMKESDIPNEAKSRP
jgi:hypothetical protein